MGAGLGGGSSDAAFTLKAINVVFDLGLDNPRLAEIAAELGSDCPFFIYNRAMYASGRGEILEPFDIDLSPCRIEVVTPGLHISTPEAYAGVDALKGFNVTDAGHSESRFVRRSIALNENSDAEQSLLAADLKTKLNSGVFNWRENVVNDFEAYAFAKYPILAKIKNDLYERGAIYASMTGSGSAVYGIFEK